MRVVAVGFTPVKGTRHASYDAVTLDAHGPVGDRAFCLVDVARRRVLRTVQNPSLLAVRSRWDGRSLQLVLPSGDDATAAPVASGEQVSCDYWGREVALDLLDGPHAALASSYLGTPGPAGRRTAGRGRVRRPGQRGHDGVGAAARRAARPAGAGCGDGEVPGHPRGRHRRRTLRRGGVGGPRAPRGRGPDPRERAHPALRGHRPRPGHRRCGRRGPSGPSRPVPEPPRATRASASTPTSSSRARSGPATRSRCRRISRPGRRPASC